MLIAPATLIRRLSEGAKDQRRLRVLDTRSPRRYKLSHIPGSSNVPMAALMHLEGSAHALVGPEAFSDVMASVGVGNQDEVVVYGERGGMDAAYLLWALHYYGHDDVSFLDGGFEGWQAAGGEVDGESVSPQKASFSAEPRPELRATADEILARLGDDDVQFVDTRTPQEFSGQLAMTQRGGHIPGALRVDWDQTMDERFGFKSPDELSALLGELGVAPDKETYLYCLSGPRAAHVHLAMRLAGFPSAKLYDRSWSEWGNRPELPVESETGA